MVRRADVHVVVGEGAVLDLAGDGLRLRHLLRLEAFAFEHVLEVHVAADVQLVRVVQREAPVLEQAGEHPMDDGGADLALYIVPDDRDAGIAELPRPLRITGDEHGDGVHEGHAGIDARLGVEALRLFGADGQVADEHVGAGVAQCLDHVDRLDGGLLDHLAVVLAQAVERGTPLHGDVEVADRGEPDGVVVAGEHRLREVDAHLRRVDVEGGDEFEVADVVATQHDVHEAGDDFFGIRGPVVLHTLDERAGTVPHPCNGYLDLLHACCSFVCLSVNVAVVFLDDPVPGAPAAGWRTRSASMRRSSHEMSCSVGSVECSARERV